jgi:hypothetical protein
MSTSSAATATNNGETAPLLSDSSAFAATNSSNTVVAGNGIVAEDYRGSFRLFYGVKAALEKSKASQPLNNSQRTNAFTPLARPLERKRMGPIPTSWQAEEECGLSTFQFQIWFVLRCCTLIGSSPRRRSSLASSDMRPR